MLALFSQFWACLVLVSERARARGGPFYAKSTEEIGEQNDPSETLIKEILFLQHFTQLLHIKKSSKHQPTASHYGRTAIVQLRKKPS